MKRIEHLHKAGMLPLITQSTVDAPLNLNGSFIEPDLNK